MKLYKRQVKFIWLNGGPVIKGSDETRVYTRELTGWLDEDEAETVLKKIEEEMAPHKWHGCITRKHRYEPVN